MNLERNIKMKMGDNFENFVARIHKEDAIKQDWIVPANEIKMLDEFDGPCQLQTSQGVFELNEHAHKQLAEKLQMPTAYYNKLRRESPDVLAHNVNLWLGKSRSNFMIRALDNQPSNGDYSCRAVLSDRYKRIDNVLVIGELISLLQETEFEIKSCEITESNMYLKAVFPFTKTEVAVGDAVEAGIMFRNSEVGGGALSATFFVHRLVCTNGMVVPNALTETRKFHSGRRLSVRNDGTIVEEQDADIEVVIARLRDLAAQSRNKAVFESVVENYREAAGDLPPFELKDRDAVRALVHRSGSALFITKDEQELVYNNLVADRDISRWGLANAITRSAQDVKSYDRATILETIGGKVIEMGSREFQRWAA